jgi:hypothetical protein
MAHTKQNQGLNERLQKIIGDDARDDTSHGFLGVGASSGRTAGYAGGGGRAGDYGSGIGPGSGGVPGAVWSLMGRAVSHGGVKHINASSTLIVKTNEPTKAATTFMVSSPTH